MENFDQNLAHMLHPHYRGHLLKKSGRYDELKEHLINEHPTTAEFHQKQQDNERQKDTQIPVLSDSDDCDLLLVDDFDPNQSQDRNTSQCMPDIERELTVFNAMPPVPTGNNVDVLLWWKNQQASLPLLAQLARDVYCIPAASSSSERVFSASGGIVTDKRQNLATETCKKLTLIKVNYDFVVNYLTLKFTTEEESLAMDWSKIKTPATATTSKASTSTQRKINFGKVLKVIHLSSSSSSPSDDSPPPPPAKTPEKRVTTPSGSIAKGKGKGKNTPSQKRKADTQELNTVTQIRKRYKMTEKEIQESIDMFENNDDDDDDVLDPDFNSESD